MALQFTYKYAADFIRDNDLVGLEAQVAAAHNMLHGKTGLGNDFTGWVNLPFDYDKDEFERIKKAADKIKSDTDVFVVIGIGGSYLGARAAIEFLKSENYNALPKDTPDIYFAGNSISGSALSDLLKICERVTAYNGGAKAVIIGTASAISNILPNGADGWRIVTDGDNMGIKLIKNFFDYDIMVLPQVATGDFSTFDMALNDNEIYVVSPSSDKLVKGVIEGSDLTNSNDFYDNANLTSNATINKRWAFEFLSNAVAGCIQLA
jgi:hypothetical protein